MKARGIMSREQGYSFIELLVTMVIFAALVGIAIPSFSVWVANSGLKKAAADLYASMNWAKANAVKGNTQWAVVFDVTPGSQGYSICSDPGGDGNWSTAGDNTIEKTVLFSNYQKGVSFGHGVASDDIPGNGAPPADDVTYPNDFVVFNSSGFSSGGYVYLQNSKGNTFGIGTKPTGIIMVRKWNPSRSRWE
ncbi:MAG: prepilin-type cleavage/methylation domain-containing protein [Deltaproteobacteria bacterium]|nr:MAG: prepilin-type cleavage/methylation domain-containing protein [Deltaproteobacteria bacterium]RLB77509.1 MAG: prepilin-type cleavage/methylation domain-containing protein [Deltaproteobacteria bacterium]